MHEASVDDAIAKLEQGTVAAAASGRSPVVDDAVTPQASSARKPVKVHSLDDAATGIATGASSKGKAAGAAAAAAILASSSTGGPSGASPARRGASAKK